MWQTSGDLKILLAPNSGAPTAFRWRGRTVRVLSVEAVRTERMERRYRLGTPEGRYELGVRLDSGAWQIRRGPGLLARWWAQVQRTPRYWLPASRRRGAWRASRLNFSEKQSLRQRMALGRTA
jgi:hypothetical protein